MIFMLATERRFHHTRKCDIWILYAKVRKSRSVLEVEVLKSFLQHTYILTWRCTQSDDDSFRHGAIFGCTHLMMMWRSSLLSDNRIQFVVWPLESLSHVEDISFKRNYGVNEGGSTHYHPFSHLNTLGKIPMGTKKFHSLKRSEWRQKQLSFRKFWRSSNSFLIFMNFGSDVLNQTIENYSLVVGRDLTIILKEIHNQTLFECDP